MFGMSRIAALLNMLSSDNAGERDNAARMLARAAQKENKTVADLVMSPQTIYRDRPAAKPEADDVNDFKSGVRPRYYRPKGDNSILKKLADCLGFPDQLTSFEWEFAEDVTGKFRYDFELSARQRKVAEKIIRKVFDDGEPLL